MHAFTLIFYNDVHTEDKRQEALKISNSLTVSPLYAITPNHANRDRHLPENHANLPLHSQFTTSQ